MAKNPCPHEHNGTIDQKKCAPELPKLSKPWREVHHKLLTESTLAAQQNISEVFRYLR